MSAPGQLGQLGPSGRLGLAVVIAVAAIDSAAAQPLLRAEPEVRVVIAPVGGTATESDSIRVVNDGPGSITVGSITAEPGCDSRGQVGPLTGFTLAPATRSPPIAISCAAAPAGMQRCHYRVRSPGNAVLASFEAVCGYAGAAALTADASSLEFGTVPVGSSVARTVRIGNTGGATLRQLFVQLTDLAGNFTVGSPCNPDARECDAAIAAIAEGGSLDITVACTPRAAGPHTGQLYLTSSAGTRLAAPIALTCTGAAVTAPVLAATPGAIDLGAVELIDGQARTTLQIGNAGGGALRLLGIQIVDVGTGAAADWRATATLPCTAAIPPECTLGAGESTSVELVFDPSAIAARHAVLLIQFRDIADRSISIPLRGRGRGATLDLVDPPAALEFGALPLGATAALAVKLVNRGTRDIADGEFVLVPPGPPFTVSAGSGPGPALSVPPGDPAAVTVSCRPTTAGTFTADLQITSADTANQPIEVAVRCTGDPAVTLLANPPAVQLGEVRIDEPRTVPLAIASTAAPISLTAATVMPGIAGLAVRGVPSTTPATLDFVIAPAAVEALATSVVVTPASGPALAIAVTGTTVATGYTTPGQASLGTFCIGQPTTPRILRLTSTGTATLGLAAPVLQNPDSPYDLELIAPVSYPARLAALEAAVIAVTPKRSAIAGDVTDAVLWTTDAAGSGAIGRTNLMTTFVEAGGAIAPDELVFDPAPIHLVTANAQEVTLRNCDASPLQLDPPEVPAPFSIDSPSFPSVLAPRETITFSVGFHPTRRGEVTRTLVIRSPQLARPLEVRMTGSGKTSGVDDSGDDLPLDGDSRTSFYACGSCASGNSSGAIAFGAAVVFAIVRRRKRAR